MNRTIKSAAAIFAVAAMSISMAACGSDTNSNADTNADTNTNTDTNTDTGTSTRK